MRGFITEKNWRAVDQVFPSVHRFYKRLARKPRTFLELLELCRSFDDDDPLPINPSPDRGPPGYSSPPYGRHK